MGETAHEQDDNTTEDQQHDDAAEPQDDRDDQQETPDDGPSDEGKVYDESYVKSLRSEAKKHRTKAQETASELETERAEVKRLRGELEKYETRDQQAAWAREVSEATGVPAEVLRGSSKDELQAHADSLAPHFSSKPNGGPRYSGTGPEKTPARDWRDLEREAYEKNKTP